MGLEAVNIRVSRSLRSLQLVDIREEQPYWLGWEIWLESRRKSSSPETRFWRLWG